MITAFIAHPDGWQGTPEIVCDLSTAYRWLKRLHQQSLRALPIIRKALLQLKPHLRMRGLADGKPEDLLDRPYVFRRLLSFAGQLLKAAVRLGGEKYHSHANLFCFLNYFLAQETAQALLMS